MSSTLSYGVKAGSTPDAANFAPLAEMVYAAGLNPARWGFESPGEQSVFSGSSPVVGYWSGGPGVASSSLAFPTLLRYSNWQRDWPEEPGVGGSTPPRSTKGWVAQLEEATVSKSVK